MICDHKFIDSTRCLKCGWEPNAAAIASKTTPLRVVTREEAETKAEHPAELVERVAKAIYEAKYGGERGWDSPLSDEKKDDFRRYARAAIEAIPRPAAPTELPETKPTAWQRLQEWLADRADGPHHTWEWHINGGTIVWLRDYGGIIAEGEGPTLDAALANALEKLK